MFEKYNKCQISSSGISLYSWKKSISIKTYYITNKFQFNQFIIIFRIWKLKYGLKNNVKKLTDKWLFWLLLKGYVKAKCILVTYITCILLILFWIYIRNYMIWLFKWLKIDTISILFIFETSDQYFSVFSYSMIK